MMNEQIIIPLTTHLRAKIIISNKIKDDIFLDALYKSIARGERKHNLCLVDFLVQEHLILVYQNLQFHSCSKVNIYYSSFQVTPNNISTRTHV